jgi:hypothetical protein
LEEDGEADGDEDVAEYSSILSREELEDANNKEQHRADDAEMKRDDDFC